MTPQTTWIKPEQRWSLSLQLPACCFPTGNLTGTQLLDHLDASRQEWHPALFNHRSHCRLDQNSI